MAEASTTYVLAIGIALGGAFVGAGLFFGLRARAPEGAAAASSVASVAAVNATATSAVRVSAAAVDTGTAKIEVARQLEGFRATLRDKCWVPAVTKTKGPDHASFTFEYTFDASGVEMARGIQSDQGKARSDVAFCLTGQTPSVTIAPQGASVHVSVPLAFP